MGRPKSSNKLERVQVYLSPETVRKLEVSSFVKKEFLSKQIRDKIAPIIEKTTIKEESNE